MEIQLTKADWEEVKRIAEDQVKQAIKSKLLNESIHEIAMRELSKLKNK